jgi:chemotaxis regulatin CheY-phosphate phosphatase CheZ
MAPENQQFSRQDLLAALEQGWKHYLTHLHELSEDEQVLYAQKQGFARIQDVLAHVVAWWERSMQRSFQIISGHAVPRTDDMDAFNAEVVEQYHQWSRETVEEKFITVLTTFERFLRDLPETAFENERIHLWLRIDAIDHYEDHRLPNAPKLQIM